MHRATKQLVSLALCCALLLPATAQAAKAAEGTLFLQSQARQLALSNSPELKSVANKITIKQIKYVEAVEILRAKKKNLRSFRWTPLLSFKFPQSLDMSQSYEFEYKPLQLQGEITTLQHEYNDLKYQVQANADAAYLECYITGEKIAFCEERLEGARSELARNKGRLLAGGATQADVDTMQSSVSALEGELAGLLRTMEAAKAELGSLTGMNLAHGFRFANPLKDLDIPREDLPAITQQALSQDHTVYLTRAASTLALMNLNAYESLMRGKYGSKMDRIGNYLAMAKNGQGAAIDAGAFRREYDALLKDVDAFWNRSIRILFFTFTMEWLKGETSGTRYIEDDLYALYSACFEYADALKDQTDAENALAKQVGALYEGLVNARAAYKGLAESLAEARIELNRTGDLNRLGKAEYSELADKRESYQTLQLDTIDALVAYNELATEFNRTTCGALNPYFEGQRIGTDGGAGGDSYAEFDPFTGPYYHLTTHVEDMVFEFGVNLPEGFEPAITHFELWFEGVQVGGRTAVGSTLRHLTLDYGEGTMATVRLYNGSSFVTECEIDTSVLRAALPIEGEAQPAAEGPRVLGSYTLQNGVGGSVTTVSLSLLPAPELDVASYTLEREGSGALLTAQPMAITAPFTYLGVLAEDLADIRAKLYDKEGKLLYTAMFDAANLQLLMV